MGQGGGDENVGGWIGKEREGVGRLGGGGGGEGCTGMPSDLPRPAAAIAATTDGGLFFCLRQRGPSVRERWFWCMFSLMAVDSCE